MMINDLSKNIENILLYEIEDFCVEIFPLVDRRGLEKNVKSKTVCIMKDIDDFIHKSEDHYQYEINDRDNHILQLEEKIRELENDNRSLQLEIDDLTMRIEQPGKWHGKKFGL